MKKRIIPAVLFLSFLSGCMEEAPTKVDVEMFNASGDSLGTVKLSEQTKGIKLELVLEGLPPGEHGFHIHENAKCEAPEFKSAGNHFNPDEKQHGLLHPEGSHAGDLQNLIADEDGLVEAEIAAPAVTLKKDAKNSLLMKEGTTLIITELKDDGMTQPSGDSGARIACGEISEKEGKRPDKKEVKPAEEKK